MRNNRKLVSVMTLAVLTCSIVSAEQVSCSTSDIKVGFYYYAWYGNGFGGRHWNDSDCNVVVDKPILGYYNSQDTTIIKQHLDWFKELNISFLIISWWGPNSYEDDTTKKIFSMAKQGKYQIEIAIMVEPYNLSGVYDFKAIYDYINETYVSQYGNIYMELDDLPLVCFFNDNVNMTRTEANRTTIRSVTGFSSRIVGHTEDYVDWWAWPVAGYNEAPKPRLCRDGYVGILPRCDDTHLPNRTNTMYEVNFAEGLYDEQWNEVLRLESESTVNLVAIYSWNEYHERSQVEPLITPDGNYVRTPFCRTQYYVQISHKPISIFLDKALDFVETQLHNYINDKWLCREFPNSSVYWVYNDNYLAYKTMEFFGRNGSASKIRKTIESYGISMEGNGRLEVLFNGTIPFPPHTGTGMNFSPIVDSSSTGDRFTVKNDAKFDQIPDWEEYADLLLFGVIDQYSRGNSTYNDLWNKACRMFDGKGMADRVYKLSDGTRYETYKLALFVITSRIINNQTVDADCALSTVWRMQDESSGGVSTHYLPDFAPDPNSTQNTETTCLAIYATVIPEFPSMLILPLFMIATVLATMIFRRKHGRL